MQNIIIIIIHECCRALGGQGNNNGPAPLPAGSTSAIHANNPVTKGKALIEGQRYVPGMEEPF